MAEAGREPDAGGRDDRSVEARVLGQILAAQNLMFVLPGDEQIAAFYAEALGRVPGVSSCVVCLGGLRAPVGASGQVCGDCAIGQRETGGAYPAPVRFRCGLAAGSGSRAIRIGTNDRTFGFFVLRLDASGVGERYWPFLENLAGFVALSLENRVQKRLVEESRDELERRVEARTRDLTAANEALSASRLAALDVMHDAIEARQRTEQASAGLQREIAERKRAEEALRASEERYRRITETITDYVFQVKVQDGRPGDTTHGPGCVAVTGYTPEEFARDPGLWLAMVVPDARPAVLEQARAVLAGQHFTPIEHCIVRKDGAVRWVRNTPVPQFGPDGSLVAYDGLIQDITERRALEEQLLQAQKMESVGRLAGGVAHDFNNLLTAVLGNVELASQDLPGELPADHPVRADLEEIAKAGERAASLTRQLLSFASKQRIVLVRLDLSAVVADSLKMLRRLLGEDIEIVTVLEPALGAVEADPGQIQQLLVNLAVNSRDAMPDGGRLVIETANETVDEAYAASHPGLNPWHYVRLSVTDTGAGMSEEVQAHIFEPFFTTKERGKGTGLGLATCHGIVKQMGGQIRVYSEPGQGTTFRILLPQVEGIAAETRAGVAAAGPTPTGTETILIVEDEPAVRRLAVLSLRAQGYTVFEAGDGDEALEIVAHLTRPLDALVSDVVMLGMSGPQLAERVLSQHPKTKLMLMSGHAEAAVLPRDVSQGRLPFLPKPFTPERLARRIREVLDSPTESGPAPRPKRARPHA